MPNAPYDIEKALETPEQCRVVMDRALAQGKRDLYAAAFRRFCKLSGANHDDPSDPLVRAASRRSGRRVPTMEAAGGAAFSGGGGAGRQGQHRRKHVERSERPRHQVDVGRLEVP
jgi:hypothetical protein